MSESPSGSSSLSSIPTGSAVSGNSSGSTSISPNPALLGDASALQQRDNAQLKQIDRSNPHPSLPHSFSGGGVSPSSPAVVSDYVSSGVSGKSQPAIQQQQHNTYHIMQANLIAMQQQQQQQQTHPSQHQSGMSVGYSSHSNKHLVEHAKNSLQPSQDMGLQQNNHTNQHFGNGNNSNNPNAPVGLYNSLVSPISLSTPSSEESPNDGSVAPFPVEAHAQQRLLQQLQQQQQQLASQQHSLASQLSNSGNSSHSPASFTPAPYQPNQAFAQVLVAGLPTSLNQSDLTEIFSSLPAYERCGIAIDPNTGASIGRGWLVFSSTDFANQAIQKMNGVTVDGHQLHLSMMQPIGESTKSNIYVAGLPKQYTQQQLEQLFSTFGTIIESKVLTDPSGVSRGVAFVRYDNSNSAAQAITAVNGHVMADGLHTYTIRVKFARDHHRNADPTLAMLAGQPSTSHNANNGGLGQVPRSAAIYQSYIPPHIKARGEDISGGIALFVFHIPAEFTSRDLQELFNPCATVLSARIAIHPQTLESKGFGFVTVATMEEAHQAVTLLNGKRVGRKFIKVSFKKQQSTTPNPMQGLGGNLGLGGQGSRNSGVNGLGGASSPLDPSTNLSSLAAALGSLGQLNQHSLAGFGQLNVAPSQQAWNAPSAPVVQTPTSPNLLNYNQQANLPLHLLMQQMQLGSTSFPAGNSNISSNGNSSSQNSNLYGSYSPNQTSSQPASNWPITQSNGTNSSNANGTSVASQSQNANFFNGQQGNNLFM